MTLTREQAHEVVVEHFGAAVEAEPTWCEVMTDAAYEHVVSEDVGDRGVLDAWLTEASAYINSPSDPNGGSDTDGSSGAHAHAPEDGSGGPDGLPS